MLDVLDSLTERERNILSLRFGLKDGYSRTLEEVGKQFKVTREQIRQIEAKALRKIRHPTRYEEGSEQTSALERKIFLHRNGQTYGPYSQSSVERFLLENLASPQDWAIFKGEKEWVRLEDLQQPRPVALRSLGL